MDNDSSLREAAVASMAEMFLSSARSAADFAAFEDTAMAAVHSMMAEAMGRALEARDAELSAGALCAEEDEAAAESLYSDGVVPDAERERACLLVEADGTFFSLQRPAEGAPRRIELKAMVAF